ncbi:unnamed protein product [Staurois parvus]|uniref:Secreted protein n=1 Tax=Staurois parvus TaxID=386267 RepID=A0ABN9HMA4_9NEOB|nr:unnamed protein product [Staurois parvus]
MPVICISLLTSRHADSCSASCQCPSVPRASAHQYHINAACQCHLSVPYECCLSVPISDACQCSSVPITAASLAHISEGEKSLIYKIL